MKATDLSKIIYECDIHALTDYLGFDSHFVGCLFFDAINMGNYFFRQYCKNSNKTSAL